MEDEISLVSSHALSGSSSSAEPKIRSHHASLPPPPPPLLINKADLTGLQIKLPHFVAITRDTIWVFILGLGYDISSFSTTIT